MAAPAYGISTSMGCSFTFTSNSIIVFLPSREIQHIVKAILAQFNVTRSNRHLSFFELFYISTPFSFQARTCLPCLVFSQNAKRSCTVKAPLFQLSNQTINLIDTQTGINVWRKLVYTLWGISEVRGLWFKQVNCFEHGRSWMILHRELSIQL